MIFLSLLSKYAFEGVGELPSLFTSDCNITDPTLLVPVGLYNLVEGSCRVLLASFSLIHHLASIDMVYLSARRRFLETWVALFPLAVFKIH